MPLIKNEIPILEFDSEAVAMIHPAHHLEKIAPSPYCVMTFFQGVIEELKQSHQLRLLTELRSEAGKHPIYLYNLNGIEVGIVHPMIGGPFAAGIMEECIALGFTKFIACGGCGVLRKDLTVGHLIIPTEALRQEGTSYQYLPPSRTVSLAQDVIHVIEEVLRVVGIPYVKGMTWTTDAIYRETKELVGHRKQEGCLCVEMECASFAAVAAFRHVRFGQILYGGDDLSSEEWSSRNWVSRHDIRSGLVQLAMKAVVLL